MSFAQAKNLVYRLGFVASLGLCSIQCGPHFPTPYSASELHADSKDHAGAALVHYLAQPTADTYVCNLEVNYIPAFSPDDAADFADGLHDAKVDPARWLECASQLVPRLARPSLDRLLQKLADHIPDYAHDALTDKSKARMLESAAVAMNLRPTGVPIPDALVDKFRGWKPTEVDPTTRSILEGLLDSAQLERGFYRESPVTASTIATVTDSDLLDRMMRRLPDPGLRQKAKERIVDMAIDHSTSPWVKQHAADVRAAVLDKGYDAFPGPVLSTRYELPPGLTGYFGIEQNLHAGTGRLVFQERTDQSAVPSLPLAGRLSFDVGLADPITVCVKKPKLDITPCMAPSRLSVSGVALFLGDDGAAHLIDIVSQDTMSEFAASSPSLNLNVSVDKASVISVGWPLRFFSPPPYLYSNGEPLQVHIAHYNHRIVLQFGTQGEAPHLAVLEDDGKGFSLTSQGSMGMPGMDGSRGIDGMRGTDGQNAMCPSSSGTSGSPGSSGGPGGNGGTGGPGGRGGDIHMSLECTNDCSWLTSQATSIVRSVGGAGGSGGHGGMGGRGGDGGRGGMGTSCQQTTGSGANQQTTTNSLSGGSDGMRGSDGMQGNSGMAGPAGVPGEVTVTTVRK